MNIISRPYGTLADGRQAILYTLDNGNGMTADITNFGGNIIRLLVPDKNGICNDVVLAHSALPDYFKNPGYLGAAVGRNSNRIGKAQIEISNTIYELDKNDGKNNLHGGLNSLSFRLMSAEARMINNEPSLLLTTTLEHMSDGFPGNLTVNICYTLTCDNTLRIDYRARSDMDTVINLTNHSYFNLAGHDSGNIYNHLLQLNAPFYSPGDHECMPTGEIASVTSTPFDFTCAKAIGEDILGAHPQIKQYGGYDHNFALSGVGYRKIGSVFEPSSGRFMEVSTDLPAVQLYTANHFRGDTDEKDNIRYVLHAGFCLETQFFPNATQMPWLMSPVFRAGEEYVASTGYKFSTK